MNENTSPGTAFDRPGPGLRTLLAFAALFLVTVVVATYPFVFAFDSAFAGGRTDPLAHLWTMKWYKSCLLEGKAPWKSPDVQYPEGLPLGFEPPLQMPTLLYIPLSIVTGNDILTYNLIWLMALIVTGLGSSLLAWQLGCGRLASAFAGVAAIVSTPVMMHAHGHVEMLWIGWFPFFLLAWIRFVDAPTRGRLLAAFAFYALGAFSMPYLAVFFQVPAILYVIWAGFAGGPKSVPGFLKARLSWFAGFGTLALPILAVGFSVQFATQLMGYSMVRPRSEFLHYGAPWWAYFVPTHEHPISRWLPDVYGRTGFADRAVEVGSYLGLVPMALLAVALAARIPMKRGAFLWALLGVFVLLSLGGIWRTGGKPIVLPAYWLWKNIPMFRMTRVPARFNLLAAMVVAVLVAVALQYLLTRMRYRGLRVGFVGVLTALMVADLAMVRFPYDPMPAMPRCYEVIRRIDPRAAVLEAPNIGAGGCYQLNAQTSYWQFDHGLRTSGGYSAHTNLNQEQRTINPSPFNLERLGDPAYLKDPEHERFGIVDEPIAFLDYVHVYLKAHGFRFVVFHLRPNEYPLGPESTRRVTELMAPYAIYKDDQTIVYDASMIPEPKNPVLACTSGWRRGGNATNAAFRFTDQTASFQAFIPPGTSSIALRLDASAFRKDREVRLKRGNQTLATWRCTPNQTEPLAAEIELPSGLHQLTLESDAAEKPSRSAEYVAENDRAAYSLKVQRIRFEPTALARGTSGSELR